MRTEVMRIEQVARTINLDNHMAHAQKASTHLPKYA